jgi:hypothetical protein
MSDYRREDPKRKHYKGFTVPTQQDDKRKRMIERFTRAAQDLFDEFQDVTPCDLHRWLAAALMMRVRSPENDT